HSPDDYRGSPRRRPLPLPRCAPEVTTARGIGREATSERSPHQHRLAARSDSRNGAGLSDLAFDRTLPGRPIVSEIDPGWVELVLLNEDRHAGEVMVAAGVIRMEMTVRDGRDVGDRSPCSTQRLIDPTHVHRSEAVDELLRLGRKAGVEEEHPLRVLDEERGH